MHQISRRPLSAALLVALLLPGATLAGAGGLDAPPAQRAIVIFRNQHPELPAHGAMAKTRAATLAAEQGAVRSLMSQLRARDVRSFRMLNALAATLSADQADQLRAHPDVLAVVPDRPLVRREKRPREAIAPVAGAAAAVSSDLCPSDPSVPMLEPQALDLMNVPGANALADGTGIKVALVADGLDPTHPDFQRDGASIFFDYQDFSTEGPNAPTDGAEAFGDASSIAAQGNVVYDLHDIVGPTHPLPVGCNVRVRGVAPGASLAAMKVFGNDAQTLTSAFVEAIEWAVVVDGVDVINESFGGNPYPDPALDPISLVNLAAIQAGVTVVSSTGDSGTTNTIGSPADAPGVIGVGASTSFRLYRQTTTFASQIVPGGWVDNNISGLSSAGFTQFGPHTLDVVAPGDEGWAVCVADPVRFSGCTDFAFQPTRLQIFGGTSQSSPLTAGVAALVIQAYAQTHNGVRPSPALVKQIIVSTATDLHTPADEQGAGLVNALEAVQLAMSLRDRSGAPPPQGNHLLVDQTSLSATGNPGTTKKFHVRVTNTGDTPQLLAPRLEALHPGFDSTDTGTMALDPQTAPQFIDGGGVPSGYVTRDFLVPDGAQWLDASVTWDGAGQPMSRVRMSLFDPQGRFAAYSLPQGPGGFNHVDVHDPTPGMWTAVFWTRKNDTVYSGAFQLAFTTRHFETIGKVTPRPHTLRPGGQRMLHVTVLLPADAADFSARLVLATGSDSDGSIPVTVRSVVPLGAHGGTFATTLSGTNGRDTFGGETRTFQFDVPSGRDALNVAIQLRDPGYDVTALLVDPDGEPLDVQSTTSLLDNDPVPLESTIQLTQRAPRAGRWTGVLVLSAPVTGEFLEEPVEGRIDFAAPSITVQGLPRSGRLAAGATATATIQVTNTGNSQKMFFASARLDRQDLLPLVGISDTEVTLPLRGNDSQPAFLVPTNTTGLIMIADSTVPIDMDMSALFGSPEIHGVSSRTKSVATLVGRPVAAGAWFGLPTIVGPFDDSGVTPVVADVVAGAVTNLFDTSIAADTGDLWLAAVDPEAGFDPLVLDPGASGTITLAITPDAASGTTVRGFVEVDAFNLNTLSGDTYAAFPYAYRVQ
jgi:subtilisin family serine protease